MKLPLQIKTLCVGLATLAFIFAAWQYKQMADRHESERLRLVETFNLARDSAEARYCYLSDCPIYGVETLWIELRLVSKDSVWSYEWALLFCKVAVYEHGHCLCRGVVDSTNCPFGFVGRQSELTFGYYKHPNGNSYNRYLSKSEAVLDLWQWTIENPPFRDERLIDWLRRRKYNDYSPNYYSKVENQRL